MRLPKVKLIQARKDPGKLWQRQTVCSQPMHGIEWCSIGNGGSQNLRKEHESNKDLCDIIHVLVFG